MITARTRPCTFPAANGGPLLAGVLHLPDGPGPFPAALVCHPHPLMGGTMDNTVVVAVCRALAARGWAGLRFDFRGAGRSAGAFDEGRGEMDDAAGALDFLRAQAEVWDHPSMAGWREELGSPTGHDLSLAQTFALSWERVADEAARRVFLTAAWCAPNQPIPCEVLERAAELDTEGCDAAVGILAGLGLVEVEDPQAGPVVHPLMAEYGRVLPDAAGALEALAGALGTVTYEANETGLPACFAPLRAHAEAVASAAEMAGLEEGGTLWNNLGYHLWMVADHGAARAAFERALGILERFLPAEHPNIGIVRGNLEALETDTLSPIPPPHSHTSTSSSA